MSFIQSFKAWIGLVEEKKSHSAETPNSPISVTDEVTHITEVFAEASTKHNGYDILLVDSDVLDVLLSCPQFGTSKGGARCVVGRIFGYPVVYDDRVKSPKLVKLAEWTDSTAERFK